MNERLPILSSSALGALADALERGALVAPFGALQVGRHVAKAEQADALHLLETLRASGLESSGMAVALRLAHAARRATETKAAPSLVWSDYDLAGSRDTAVVCNELFREARESVLVSTYNLGHRAKEGDTRGNPVLLPLAKRMEAVAGLRVRLFVNVRRLKHMAGASEHAVEDAFVAWFRREIWPWSPVPDIFYDPRSIDADEDETSCLHAKCVVVDDRRALVTSANLTEAAQTRNIEAGVLLDDAVFARTLRTQFESLIARGCVRQLTRGISQ